MMDANLDLQIEAARRAARHAKRFESSDVPTPDSARSAEERRGDVFELAPEILTLCSGSLKPFDFGLTAEQHTSLYHAGQLFTHLYATVFSGEEGGARPLSDEQKLKALLWVLRLDYP